MLIRLMHPHHSPNISSSAFVRASVDFLHLGSIQYSGKAESFGGGGEAGFFFTIEQIRNPAGIVAVL